MRIDEFFPGQRRNFRKLLELVFMLGIPLVGARGKLVAIGSDEFVNFSRKNGKLIGIWFAKSPDCIQDGRLQK